MGKKFIQKSKLFFNSKNLVAKAGLLVLGIAALLALAVSAAAFIAHFSPLDKYETKSYSLLVPKTFKPFEEKQDSNGDMRTYFTRNGNRDDAKATDLAIIVSFWDASGGKAQQGLNKFDEDWKSGAANTKSDVQGFRNMTKRTINGHEARQFEGYSKTTNKQTSTGLYVYTDTAIYLLVIYNYDTAPVTMQALVPQIADSFFVK